MRVLFWTSVAWLIYLYAGYGVLVWLLGRFRRVRPTRRADFLPSVSVLISARNEEKDIGWKVRETLDWDYPAERLQLLVASDASEDSTDDILAAIDDSRLTFVRLDRRSGKNRALNRLAELATGDLLFFTDANSHVRRDCLRNMVTYFADERVGCVTGTEVNAVERRDGAVAPGSSAYARYESLLNRFESALGSVLVCDGSIFCMRRAMFRPVSAALANDLELPLRIGAEGKWLLYDAHAQSLEKATSSFREEFARKRRICAQGMLGAWELRHCLRGWRAWQFASRKLLRWLAVVPLMALLISSVSLSGSPPFVLLLVLQVLFYALALAGLLWARCEGNPPRCFALPFYFVLVNLAAFVGVIDACRGRRFQVWDIAALSRGSAKPSI